MKHVYVVKGLMQKILNFSQ